MNALRTFIYLPLASTAVVHADPGAEMGSGNFNNGETGSTVVNQHNALKKSGAKMARFAIYPDWCWVSGVTKETLHDAAIRQAYTNGITPTFYFEDDLAVVPGGWGSPNAYGPISGYLCSGYAGAVALLINSGKLAGIALHTYNDVSHAPIVRSNGVPTFNFSPQYNFDQVKSANGITDDCGFYSTEFNFKKDTTQKYLEGQDILSIDEALAAKRYANDDSAVISGSAGAFQATTGLEWWRTLLSYPPLNPRSPQESGANRPSLNQITITTMGHIMSEKPKSRTRSMTLPEKIC